MSAATPTQTPIVRAEGADLPAAEGGLPVVVTALAAGGVLARMDLASRRGRMPGFQAGTAGSPEGLFRVAAHGQPFDAVLIAHYEDGPREGRLRFTLFQPRRMQIVFAVALALTVWPGEYFMDQLIPGEWGWIPTWWWYLPLTVAPIPWLWRKVISRSRAAVDASAREAVGKIAAEVEGRVVGAGTQR